MFGVAAAAGAGVVRAEAESAAGASDFEHPMRTDATAAITAAGRGLRDMS
jgi:hypothetical protein